MQTTKDAREERGRQLASTAQIRRVGRRWAVPSQSRASERYLVDIEESACTCPDYEERRGTCKHVHAVLFWIAWGRDGGHRQRPARPRPASSPAGAIAPLASHRRWPGRRRSQVAASAYGRRRT